MLKKSIRTLVMVMLSVLASSANAQIIDDAARVDTLTLMERLSLRTNMVDWSLLTPNIGLEFDLKNTNWSRWAVGMNFKYNWNSSHTFTPGIVYNIAEVRAEVRNYWRTLDLSDPSHNRLAKHKSWLDKLVSQRRSAIKHLATAYYRGIYLSYTDYSFLFGHTGHQGKAIQAGVTYGIVRPLYQFTNGNSVNLEFGISVGAAYTSYDKYRHDRQENCYPATGHENWHLVKHPVINEMRAGVVYRFGNYPVTKKYRRRYDVDLEYQARIDSINEMRLRMALEKHYRDSVYNIVFNEFEHLYDSISRAQLATKDSIAFAHRGTADIEQRNAKTAEKTALKQEHQINVAQAKTDKARHATESKLEKVQRATNRKAQQERKAQQDIIDKQKATKQRAVRKAHSQKEAAVKEARRKEAVEARKARKIQDKRDEDARQARVKALESEQNKAKEGQEGAP